MVSVAAIPFKPGHLTSAIWAYGKTKTKGKNVTSSIGALRWGNSSRDWSFRHDRVVHFARAFRYVHLAREFWGRGWIGLVMCKGPYRALCGTTSPTHTHTPLWRLWILSYSRGKTPQRLFGEWRIFGLFSESDKEENGGEDGRVNFIRKQKIPGWGCLGCSSVQTQVLSLLVFALCATVRMYECLSHPPPSLSMCVCCTFVWRSPAVVLSQSFLPEREGQVIE